MLIINDLKVEYGNLTVLDNLEIEIPENTIHGLVGLNGSGKTTLLNTIYGIKQQTFGTIKFKGREIHRKDIAYLETVNYFYPRITGREYLNLFKAQNKNFDIDQWNDLFELPLKKLIDDYSTGMKKKLAFMGVICLNREILVLDEPLNGVDMETVQKIKALLIKFKAKKTILITSHILESLLSICDNISYLNGGKIQFTKEKTEFSNIENEIFSVHQDKINSQINKLTDF